jgi:hypothetical protein
MKRILFALTGVACALMLTGCTTQVPPCDDQKDFELKGNVRSSIINTASI